MDLTSALLRPLLFLTAIAGAGALTGLVTGAVRRFIARRRQG